MSSHNFKKPALGPDFPSEKTISSGQVASFQDSLDRLPPAKRELYLLYEAVEAYKVQLKEMTCKYDNAQKLLRDMHQLEKEKHYYMCNSLFSTLLGVIGGLVVGGTVGFGGMVPIEAAGVVGMMLIAVSLLLGACKPLVMEAVWRLVSKRKHEFKCPHCYSHLTDKDVK